MTSTVIKPTVGRRVWFRPSAAFLASNPILTQFNPEQPMDAGIVYVHHDHMVNLIVTDHVGKTLAVPSVPLLAGQYVAGEDADVYCCCEWMPYQKGQAAKTEAAEKATALGNEYRQPSQREQLEYALVSGAASYLAANASEATVIANGIKEALNVLHPQPVAAPKTAISGAVAAHEVFANLTASAYAGLNAADSLEREIQAKADKGPRVTPAALQAEIVSADYFTAFDGVAGAAYNEASPDGVLRPFTFTAPGALSLLTFCVLVLRNGFTVVGHSACASPENYNKEIGERIARENAERQIWPLLGFRLRDELAR